MDFVEQIGSRGLPVDQRRIGDAAGSGGLAGVPDPAQPTTLAKERAANGHTEPYKIAFLGIGNENWDCGGNMTPTTT